MFEDPADGGDGTSVALIDRAAAAPRKPTKTAAKAAAVVDVSVVIPCRNEEANVAAITQAVSAELVKADVRYEIILIDNASTDATVAIARRLCQQNPAVRLIINNRDYGQMRSPTHGIYQASGRAVIGMCADFQDPPALIGEFIARWRAGTKIVLGVRETERSSPMLSLVRGLGYEFLRRFGDYPIIPGATGFGLYDREVVDCLAAWREPEPFFRGMLVESGYSLETIAYHRPPRAGGRSNNNFFTLLDFAISGLTSCGKHLMRLPLYLAALCGLASIVTAAVVTVAAAGGSMSWGFLWVAVMQFFLAWMFLFLGLIGDQIRVISDRTRNTPLVIERERINFPDPAR